MRQDDGQQQHDVAVDRLGNRDVPEVLRSPVRETDDRSGGERAGGFLGVEFHGQVLAVYSRG